MVSFFDTVPQRARPDPEGRPTSQPRSQPGPRALPHSGSPTFHNYSLLFTLVDMVIAWHLPRFKHIGILQLPTLSVWIMEIKFGPAIIAFDGPEKSTLEVFPSSYSINVPN